jgi:uncharacterized membrane protein
MVIRKTLGYVLTLVGVIGIAAWAIPQVKATIPQISLLSDTMLLIVSIVLAIVGLFLATRGSSGRVAREVPIYHGKNIVGYRRH